MPGPKAIAQRCVLAPIGKSAAAQPSVS